MDDWRTYGPSMGTWIDAYDPETGKAERVQLCLPILLPSYMLRAARLNEVRLIRGRTKKRFYSLIFMGFPPLIIAEDTLGLIGIRGYQSAAATSVRTTSPRPRCTPVPEPVPANGHRLAPYN